MKIRHKGLFYDRFDAPFIGTLISSIACGHSCPGCQNEYLKHLEVAVEEECSDIIQKIVDNPFSEGLILGGLEWTLQATEMIDLIISARLRGLEVILYTYRTKEEMEILFPQFYEQEIYKGMYIKYGEYDETKLVHDYSSYGVPLASSNQYIERIGYTES